MPRSISQANLSEKNEAHIYEILHYTGVITNMILILKVFFLICQNI